MRDSIMWFVDFITTMPMWFQLLFVVAETILVIALCIFMVRIRVKSKTNHICALDDFGCSYSARNWKKEDV